MNLSSAIKDEDLKEIFDALEEAFEALSIDYYLIGAIARDVWYTVGGKSFRTSKDVDFAAMIGSTADYEAVRTFLIERNFTESKGNAFVLINPKGVQIDILPFGGIEIDSSVQLHATGMASIQVNGFQEVYQAGTATMTMKTGHEFKVATLPAIVLLKMIAFDDRPERRQKDAKDIANIVEHFFDLQSEFIYTEHSDIFQLEDELIKQLTLQDIAATVMGREIAKIIDVNIVLGKRIIKMLENHIQARENSPFVRLMAIETGKPITVMVNWLERLRDGMQFRKITE